MLHAWLADLVGEQLLGLFLGAWRTECRALSEASWFKTEVY